jgi:hypothetical protein
VTVPAARCDLTDLPTDGCAHCKGLNPTPAAPRGHQSGDLGPWISARYEGRCAGCGDDINPGDTIRADGQGGWLCHDCGTEAEHG